MGHTTWVRDEQGRTVDTFYGDASQTVLNDAKLHAKYAAAVMVKIGLRPGNNIDILEALGLIPTVRDHS